MDLIKYCLTEITLDINSDAIANYNMWSNSFLPLTIEKCSDFSHCQMRVTFLQRLYLNYIDNTIIYNNLNTYKIS